MQIRLKGRIQESFLTFFNIVRKGVFSTHVFRVPLSESQLDMDPNKNPDVATLNLFGRVQSVWCVVLD